MQEVAGEQGAAYIPMPKGRGFTPHFDKSPSAPLMPLRKEAPALSAGASSFTGSTIALPAP